MFCSGRGICGIQSNSPSSVHLPSLCWGYKGDIKSCFVASIPLMLVCSFHLTLTPIGNMGSLGNMTDVRGAGWQGGYWCRSVELQTHTSGVAQCRYPRRTTWRAQLYVWRKKYQINFNVFSCLPLSSFFLKCVLLLNGLFISFVFLFVLLFHFTRSRRLRCPLQTPGQHLQCPWEQCPQWAVWTSSWFCTRWLSCPTGLCVSVEADKCKRS